MASGVFPAASVTAGFAVRVPQATVQNSGNLKSGTFRYGYYLSTDAGIHPKQDPLLVAGTLLPKLQPGETNTVGPADVTIPSTVAAGSYYYGIAFDDTGHVGETDETNNFVSAPLIVASLGTVDQQQPLIDAAAVRAADWRRDCGESVPGSGGRSDALSVQCAAAGQLLG